MTVRELRELLAAAERVSGLPWTSEDDCVVCGDGDWLVSVDAAILHHENAALLVAAVNALPALLDIADAHRDHSCQREHWSWMDDPPPCPICDALDRLGETP